VSAAGAVADDDLDSLTTYLAAYIEAPGEEETAAARECAAESRALVDRYIGAASAPAAGGVPDVIRTRAIAEVGADLYHRKSARNGIVGFNSAEVSPIRIARDPMVAAYSVLLPFLGPGIG
jgi:hypothetical protein